VIIIWSEQARREWGRQHRFYFAKNPDAARRLRRAVMEGVKRLHIHPRMGRPGRVDGTRELVIADTPYIVVYQESHGRVEILHVYDGRQDWQGSGE
jgi:toxin ParE1/3/4